jgi:hypothetical protein
MTTFREFMQRRYLEAEQWACGVTRGQEDIAEDAWDTATETAKAKYDDARSLLDGCYEIVELFNPETPSQVEWRQQWLESARKHGSSGL